MSESLAASPSPETIRAARQATGLTQAEAGQLIYATRRAWQMWEAGERSMHPALWELWRYKARAIDEIERLPPAA